MKIMVGAAFALAVAGAAGCSAETPSTRPSPTMTRAQAAALLGMSLEDDVSAPAEGLIPAPPPGKGQIVFFRNSAWLGWPSLFTYTVKENGRKLGNLSNGKLFILPVEPGRHVFTAATDTKDTLRLEVEAGETYYVRGTLYWGLVWLGASILPSDEASFEGVYNHLRPAKTWPGNFSVAGDSHQDAGSFGN